ncbi:MAG: TetR/AcrR family transcriptional regulator [Deltaproteobacteria bacterium]|nr:TetR/AcrR family transcriptional regulator [Nannocystaceae bacterium]
MKPSVSRDIRRRFVEAAWRLGCRRGLKGLTVRALAEEIGVSAALLYSHYDDKASLLAELQRYGQPMLVASLAEALHRSDGHEPVLAVALAYLEFMREHGWAYEQCEPPLHGNKLPHHAAFVERAEPLLGGEQGGSGAARLQAMHLWLGVHALGMLLAHDGSLVGRGDELLRAHVELLVRGLTGMGTAANAVAAAADAQPQRG